MKTIEDDQKVSMALEIRFHANGYETVTARNSSLGATLVRSATRDLIVLDISLPDGTQWPHKNPYFYTSVTLDPSMYLTRPYAPLDKRLEAFMVYLGKFRERSNRSRRT